jgi:hypothetical protein
MRTGTAIWTVLLLVGLTAKYSATAQQGLHLFEVDTPIVVVDGFIKVNRKLNIKQSGGYKDSRSEKGPDKKPNVATSVSMVNNPLVLLPLPSAQHPWTVSLYNVTDPNASGATPAGTISCSDATGNKIDFYLPGFAYNNSDKMTENKNVDLLSATVDLGQGATPTVLTCPSQGAACDLTIHYCENAQCK